MQRQLSIVSLVLLALLVSNQHNRHHITGALPACHLNIYRGRRLEDNYKYEDSSPLVSLHCPIANKLVFKDDLDQEFENSQPAAKYDCPPSWASPTLGENEYIDREADTDIIMGMDEDPVDRDFYVDEDVRVDGDPILRQNFSMHQSDGEYPSRPDSPPLHFPASDDESLDNQSILSLDLGTSAITHDEHHEWVSTGEDIEGGDEHVWDPEVDPEYLSNNAVLEDGLAQEDQPSELEDILPHALSEHPALLNGYLTNIGGVPPELELDNMARTLRTVEKRLGVDTSKIITTYILCPSCWKMYHPSEFRTLQNPTCAAPDCSTMLFQMKRTTSEGIKRIPFKVMPVASLKTALARLLMRPGKWDELQHWRREGDHKPAPPITQQEWYATKALDEPLHDIYDGWMWRSVQTGMESSSRFLDIKILNKFMLRFRLELWIHPLVSKQLGLSRKTQKSICVHVVTHHSPHWLIQFALIAQVEFCYRNSEKQLKWKFIYRDSDDADTRKNIAERKGVCTSILDRLPTWNGALSIPSEIMHLFWGPGASGQIHKGRENGEKSHPWIDLLSFWNPCGGRNNSGWFQIKIASGGKRPKADEWRNFMRVYPVALAVAWQMWTRQQDEDAPAPRKRTKVHQAVIKSKELLHKRRIKNLARDEDAQGEDYIALEDIEASRNYHDHYQNVLRYCTATQIFASQSITPQEATRASDFMSEASQSWAAMNCHLTLNFHFAGHLLEYINTYGPAYAWWVFPYERAIGILGKANHNGHGGGEVEGTFMRAWWKSILIQELLMHLQARPNQTDEDKEIVQLLLKAVKGGAEHDRQRGTLLNYLALLSAPKDSVNMGAAKYGSSLHHRGKGFCYGYVNGRHAARVNYILSVTIPHQNPPVIVNLALIRRFQEPTFNIEHPWSLSATDLGIATWKYNELGNLEACCLEDLTGQFAFAHIRIPHTGHFWVTFSLDTTTQEPDTNDNEPDES
ncbi:hypothetical protein EV424DRAFT_1353856 [Suillus variegatus]|nr:hypothetical protein EV424DRAFT_1353856 [Suillus variegatus]